MIQLFRNVKNIGKMPSFQTLDIKCHQQFKDYSDFIPISIERITTLSLSTNHIKKINCQPSYSFSFLITKPKEEKEQNNGQQQNKIKLLVKDQYFTNFTKFLNFYQRNKQVYSLSEKCELFKVGLMKIKHKHSIMSDQKQMMLVQIEYFVKQLDAEVKKIPFNALLVDHRVIIKQNIFNIISLLLYQQSIKIINQNQNLKSLIAKDRLAKVLLQNFHISQFQERYRILRFFLIFHKEKLQYLSKLKLKIMQMKSIPFEKLNFHKIIWYFYNVNVQLLGLLKTPNEVLFSSQIIHQYIMKIQSNHLNINLEFFNKFISSIRAYQVNIDKYKLIQLFNLYQKNLNKDTTTQETFQEFLKFIRFTCQRIHNIDYPDQLDIKIREKVIKFLQFYNQLEKESQQFLNEENLNNLLIIMSKINYFNRTIWKKIQDSFFKNLKKSSLISIERHVEARISFYEQVSNHQKSFLSLQQRQKMTFKYFFEKLFANLLNQKLLRLQNMAQLLKICNVPLNSEFIQKIHKYIVKMEKKQNLSKQNQKKLE